MMESEKVIFIQELINHCQELKLSDKKNGMREKYKRRKKEGFFCKWTSNESSTK